MTTSAIVNSAMTARGPSGAGKGHSRVGRASSGIPAVRRCSGHGGHPSPPRDRARGTRPGGGVPTAQAVGDVRLVRRRPVAHRGGDQQVAEAAEEGHRRDHHGARGAGALREARERVKVRLDLGRHIHIRDAGAQRRLDQRGGGRGERPGAVDHGGRAVQRAVERGRIVDRRRRASSPGWACASASACPGRDRGAAGRTRARATPRPRTARCARRRRTPPRSDPIPLPAPAARSDPLRKSCPRWPIGASVRTP